MLAVLDLYSHSRHLSLVLSSLTISFSFCFLPQLRFQPSQSKNKLYLGNIPKDMMKDAIRAKLNEHVKGSHVVQLVVLHPSATPLGAAACTNAMGICCMIAGVVDVEVVMSKEAPGTGRGFCFVEFYNHSAAAHAKGVLGSDSFRCLSTLCQSSLEEWMRCSVCLCVLISELSAWHSPCGAHSQKP